MRPPGAENDPPHLLHCIVKEKEGKTFKLSNPTGAQNCCAPIRNTCKRGLITFKYFYAEANGFTLILTYSLKYAFTLNAACITLLVGKTWDSPVIKHYWGIIIIKRFLLEWGHWEQFLLHMWVFRNKGDDEYKGRTIIDFKTLYLYYNPPQTEAPIHTIQRVGGVTIHQFLSAWHKAIPYVLDHTLRAVYVQEFSWAMYFSMKMADKLKHKLFYHLHFWSAIHRFNPSLKHQPQLDTKALDLLSENVNSWHCT